MLLGGTYDQDQVDQNRQIAASVQAHTVPARPVWSGRSLCAGSVQHTALQHTRLLLEVPAPGSDE